MLYVVETLSLLRQQKQGDHSDFKASLDCIVTFRPARAIYQDYAKTNKQTNMLTLVIWREEVDSGFYLH